MDARIAGLSSLLFLTAWASPAKIDRVDFRHLLFAEPIVLNKTSPSFAALEDARTDYYDREKFAARARAVPAEKLITGPYNILREQPRQILQLRGQVISSQAATRPVVKKDYLAAIVAEQQSRMQEKTYKEYAEVLVSEELVNRRADQRDPVLANKKIIPTRTGGEIIVTKPVHIVTGGIARVPASQPNIYQGGKTQGSQGTQNPAKKRVPPQRTIYTPTPQNNDPVASNEKRSPTKSVSAAVSSFQPSKPARYIIKGTITFSEGAVLMGRGDLISTQQVVDGLVISQGEVNINEASFRISVDTLEGLLQTDIRSPEGRITASGSINLYDLAKSVGHVAKIQDLAMVVRPTSSGAQADVISAASYGQSTFQVGDARLFVADIDREMVRDKKTGKYQDTSLVAPSSYILTAQRDRFWPSLAMAESGSQTQVRLFPDGLVKALLELTLDKYVARDAQQKGIVWGRVAYQGRPIQGAQIQIVGEENALPVYFSGFIPDKTKVRTTTNGEFAMTNLEAGEKLLRVMLGDKNYWPVMTTVERKSVTYADLVIQPRRTIQLESYDAFTLESKATALQPLGTQEEIYIDNSGRLSIEVDTVRGTTYIEADAGEPYVVSRVALKSEQTEVYVPQIQENWLNQLRAQKEPYKGLPRTQTVGFVGGDDFEVLVGNGESVPAKIVYFDAQGREVKNHGVAGGGYIIYDLVPGMHTITIIPGRSKNIVTQVVYIDDKATQITRTNLMF